MNLQILCVLIWENTVGSGWNSIVGGGLKVLEEGEVEKDLHLFVVW